MDTPVTTSKSGRLPLAVQPLIRPAVKAPLAPPPDRAIRSKWPSGPLGTPSPNCCSIFCAAASSSTEKRTLAKPTGEADSRSFRPKSLRAPLAQADNSRPALRTTATVRIRLKLMSILQGRPP
ncbi:hypothetical protein D3C81_1570110 [compost metagenome]